MTTRTPERATTRCPLREYRTDTAQQTDQAQCPHCGYPLCSTAPGDADGWGFLTPGACLPDLQATTKKEVFCEMVGSLVAAGAISEADTEEIVSSLLRREELASTGIGRGVAIPHTRHATVSKLVGSVARSHRGIDFESLDGMPVRLVFLIVSPPRRPGDHLRALESISRHVGNSDQPQLLADWRHPDHE